MTEHPDQPASENAEAIVIPTPSGEEIAIDLSELPEAKEMLELLIDERVPLVYWIQVAKGYYSVDRFDDFVTLLEQAEKTSVTDGNSKDRLRCMDMLAAYYVKEGMKSRDEGKRKFYYGKATVLYTTADKLVMYDADHLIGRAYFCLVESVKWEQAKTQFDYVLNLRANDIIAIIGMGLVYYRLNKYENALAYFKRALRCNPYLPAEVRLGFGHCYIKVKNFTKARASFERILSLDPANISARIALASCIFHDSTTDNEKEISEAILKAVYETDKENPVVLLHLANIMFLNQVNSSIDKQEISLESESLAWKAYDLLQNGEIKAQAIYMMARHYHLKRDFDKAAQHYQRAIDFSNNKFILAYYGLGQIQLGRGEFSKAIESFEKVLKEYPDNIDTMKILGCIYARWDGSIESDNQRDSKKKAYEYLIKVYEKNKYDVEVILELAQLQEITRPDEALKKYQLALSMLENHEDFKIPAEMYSNIGTLHYQLGNYVDSKKYYEKAKEIVISDNELSFDESTAKLITLDYNMGRLCEALGRCDEAEEIYNDILTKKPGYTDAILRIGCILRDRSDINKAHNRFKDALSIDTENPVPWLFIANLHMEKGETKLAQSNYEQVLKTNKTHAYALVGLGNVWLDALYNVRTGEKDEKEKIKKFRDTATGIFSTVLKHHPRNAWGANGIACVLVHRGKIQDARDLFSQVREAAPDLSDVFLNLSHIHMETKQYPVACQMYKNFMKRNRRQFDVQLLQYAARASWKAQNYVEAKEFLQRAIIEAPDNLLVRYNMAIVLQAMASLVIREPKATIQQLEGAVEDLKEAERAFTYLAGQPDNVMIKFRYVSRSICNREARSCKDLLAQAKQFYDSACKKEAKEREQQEYLRQKRLEQIRKNEEAESERQRLRKQQEEELRRQRAQIVEKTKEILRVAQTMEVKETKKKSGGRKRKDEDDFVNDSSDMGDWNPENGERPKKEKKRKRKRDKSKREGSGSEDDERESKRRRKKQKQEEREREREEKLMRKGKIKSKAVVSSSSSSEESDTGEINKPKTPESEPEPSQPVRRAILSDTDSDISDKSEQEEKDNKSESSDNDESDNSPKPQKTVESSDSDGNESRNSPPPPKKRAIVSSSDEDS